jgi:3'-phosphoadenosine 5'-phosphosulfate sulfotransferase (PAPS reductase)/FAD synthetase
MSVDVLDDLEAGELAVEFEGEEPEVVIEWAIERFSPSLSISTAFQTDGAVLLHMAYQIDPNIKMFSVDTGRLPSETFELIEQMYERYPKLQLDLLSPLRSTRW